jgi:hypothetical protein
MIYLFSNTLNQALVIAAGLRYKLVSDIRHSWVFYNKNYVSWYALVWI